VSLLCKNGRESSLKQMPDSAGGVDKPLRVDPIELAHPQREHWLWSLNEEMRVIVHQTIGMALPPKTGPPPAEGVHPTRPTLIIAHDSLAGVAAAGDVIHPMDH
jgi:hypothetical protein